MILSILLAKLLMLSPLQCRTAATAANDAEVAEVLIPIRPLELEQRRRAPPAMHARERALQPFLKALFGQGLSYT